MPCDCLSCTKPWKRRYHRRVRYLSFKRLPLVRRRIQHIAWTGMMHWGDDVWSQVWMPSRRKPRPASDLRHVRPYVAGNRPGWTTHCFTGWDSDKDRFVCKGSKRRLVSVYKWSTKRPYRQRVKT